MNIPDRPRTFRAAAVLALLVAACQVAGSAATGSAAPAATALLTPADVPGYQQTVVPDNFPDGSDHPDCMNTLNDLDGGPGPAGVDQARVDYAVAQLGPWLRETVRIYPSANAAGAAWQQADSVLAGCGLFTVSWADGGTVGTETVARLTAPALGDQSTAYAIHFALSGIQTGETDVVVRRGRAVIILANSAEGAAPDISQTWTIAANAVDRVGGAG